MNTGLAKKDIAITGISLLTPLDVGEKSTWQAICAGKRVAGKTSVGDDLLEEEEELDRSIRLGLTVARNVLDGEVREDTALFCGTSKGPVGVYLAACETVRRGGELSPMAALQVALGTGAMGAILRKRLGIAGPAHTSVAACSSGMFALHRAAEAIRRGECERALVVAADSSRHPLFEASFDRLGVLAPRDDKGVRRCEPFGEKGEGFFLVEAGAAVMLERGELVVEREPVVWLEDSWIGGDSTGLIAVDAEGKSLRAGLRAVRGEMEVPAFVHAHATGTGHDRFEMRAIREVIGKRVPVFSHKKFLGHSLGAAGLVSVVISAMCHREGWTMEGACVEKGARSITIAQGFGGHIGMVVLRGCNMDGTAHEARV